MNRSIYQVSFLVLLVGMISMLWADTLNVPSGSYPSIQSAIDAANLLGGDEIVVAAGTYNEALTINKSLTIRGVLDGDRPLINLPDGLSGIVTITASNVTLNYLHFYKNDQVSDTAILNIPRGGSWPSYTIDYSDVIFDDLIVEKGRRGAFITGTDVSFVGCDFLDQSRDCIYFDAVSGVTNVSGSFFRGDAATSKKAILFENFSSADPEVSGTINITGNTVQGKYQFFLYNQWIAGTGSIDLNIEDNNVLGVGGSAIIFYYPIDFTKFNSILIDGNTLVTSGTRLSVYVDYADGGTSLPSIGQMVVTNNNFSVMTPWGKVDDTVHSSYPIGYSAGSPVGMSMAMFTAEDNTIITSTNVWVDDDWSGSDIYAEVSPGKLYGLNAFATINSGIAGVSSSGLVNVAAGTYTEDVLINKPLSLIGANANIFYGTGRGPESIIQPFTSGGPAISLGSAVVPDNVTVNGFEITGPMSENGIYCGIVGPSYLTIKYNYIHHIGSDRDSQNIYAVNYRCEHLNQTDINISYNYFDYIYNPTHTYTKSSAAIWMGQSPATGTISNVLIEHNTIKNVFRSAGTIFGADGPNASGINIGCGWKSTGNLANPIIRYNDISYLTGGVVYGIALQGNTPGAQVYGNTFGNFTASSNPQNSAGLCIFHYVDPVSGLETNNGTGITAYDNSFINAYYGIYSATTNIVDGSNNWWGNNSGPFHADTNTGGLGSAVSDYVVYDPWWANAEMDVIDSNAPVENVTQNLFYNTIQAAVTAAAVGDEIIIAAGTYNENVVVPRYMTITGAGSNDTIINGTGGNVLQLSAGVDATHRMLVSGVKLIGGVTGIVAGSYTTLNDVIADGNSNYGINLNSLTDLLINNSSFINNLSAGLKLASTATASHISIDNCHFDNNYQGWYSDASSSVEPDLDTISIVNTTFSGNTIKGFYTERLSNAMFDNITVDGSGCLGTYIWGAGIDVNLKWKAYSNITIKNSTFNNCGVGSLNGVGLTIKGRDDGGIYGANPGTLSNVLINNVSFSGNKNGLNFGEPGQNNAGPSGVEIKNCTFNNLEMAINNFSQSDVSALVNNTFTGTSNDFEVEEVVYHKVDNPVKGLVKWVEDSIYVPATQTIQAAITAASPDDEIIIEGGTYQENLLINKMVSLRPANREPIILDGGGSGSVITITANGVEVLGLTIQNSGSGQTDAGVLIQNASNCLIQGNTLTDNGHGVLMIMGGSNTIKQNSITGNDYYGVALVASSGNTIESNSVNTNGFDAIAMINAEDLGHPEIVSSANHIKTNTISSNRDGVFIGEACNGNFVTDNNTITAASIGVSIWRPGGQTITGNTITGCSTGIRLLGSCSNTITGNMISGNQTGIEIDGSWQVGVWYSSDDNTILNNRIMNNAIYGINASEAHQNLVTAEHNYWGDPAGPTNVRTGNSVVNVDYDPWWINYDMTILSSNVTISLSTPEHLIRDLEQQPYTVTLAQVEDLRGFNVQVKVPVVDYQMPVNFEIGPLFQMGNNTLFTFDSSDDDYWMIDVTGSYDENGVNLDGPNLVLFTFDLISAEYASNLVGSQIELPLAQVLMYSEMNQYIPCAGTTGEVVIIDSDEPVLAPIADLGTLLIDPVTSELGFPKVVATYLNLSFSDDYNLDTIDYLIQASGADPEYDDFGISIASLIDALEWENDAWQIPDATLNAAVGNLASGDYTIYFRAVDDAGNFMIEGINFTINRSVPDPIVWAAGSLACRTAEDYNNAVVLNWLYDDELYISQTPHTTMNFDVWYLNYDDLENAGGYPLYNPASFVVQAIPSAPNPYSVTGVDGLWTRDFANDPEWDITAIPSYSHLHLINDRGYFYYVVFARDAFGNMSPASEIRESISYWPGMVYDVPDGPFGATISASDIALLADVWGLQSVNPLFDPIFDVGPSVGRARRGRPTPDGRINIEDLMMFSMNYENTNYGTYPRGTSDSRPLAVKIQMQQQISGNELSVNFMLTENNGEIKGLNIPMEYGSGLELLSFVQGPVWGDESMVLYTNENGVIELSGARLDAGFLEGNGLVASLVFKINGQETELTLKHMIARAADNSDIDIIDNPENTPSDIDDPAIIPTVSFLGSAYPNPFNPSTTISFGLNESGSVNVKVYNARGQLVDTLVNGELQAGLHTVVWNGLDHSGRPMGSGIYFIRMQTRFTDQTIKTTLIK